MGANFSIDTQAAIKERIDNQKLIQAGTLENMDRTRQLHADYYQKGENAIKKGYMSFTDLSAVDPPPRFWPLEPGQQMASVSYPPERNDWLVMKEQYDNEICDALGIPKSLLSGEGRVLAGIEANTKTFYQTIQYYRNFVARVLTEVYHIIFFREEISKVGASQVIDPEAKDKITKKDFKDIYFQNRIRFEFPEQKLEDFQKQLQKFGAGVLPWEELQSQARRVSGVSDELKMEPNPWKPEERKLFAFGGKMPTMPSEEKPAAKKQKTG
jgi:hypothetical protein